MQIKSLTIATFILGLGVIAGCDDPEVQNKVADAMLHGITSASIKCGPVSGHPFSETICGVSNVPELQVQLFVDGSSLINAYIHGGPLGTGFQFTPRGNYPTLNTYNGAGPAEIYVDTTTGYLHYSSGCDSPPATGYFTLNADNCSGFNLEAFGITP